MCIASVMCCFVNDQGAPRELHVLLFHNQKMRLEQFHTMKVVRYASNILLHAKWGRTTCSQTMLSHTTRIERTTTFNNSMRQGAPNLFPKLHVHESRAAQFVSSAHRHHGYRHRHHQCCQQQPHHAYTATMTNNHCAFGTIFVSRQCYTATRALAKLRPHSSRRNASLLQASILLALLAALEKIPTAPLLEPRSLHSPCRTAFISSGAPAACTPCSSRKDSHCSSSRNPQLPSPCRTACITSCAPVACSPCSA